jgi:hypothetical protein
MCASLHGLNSRIVFSRAARRILKSLHLSLRLKVQQSWPLEICSLWSIFDHRATGAPVVRGHTVFRPQKCHVPVEPQYPQAPIQAHLLSGQPVGR